MNNNISNTSARLGALRTAIYAFSIALLAALGTHNVIEQKTIDAIVPLIFPAFALAVAIYNVFPKKRRSRAARMSPRWRILWQR